MEFQPAIYDLPGATVAVHKPFGDQYYYALVELDGHYPGLNKVAHNIGRREYVHLVEGTANLTVNNIPYILQPIAGRLINDGDHYSLEGKAKLMVLVEDQVGGVTHIEDIPGL